jgi:hypothetical protein
MSTSTSARADTTRTWPTSRPGALEGIEITYVQRMDDVFERVLETDPMAAPAEYFSVPDTEKRGADVGAGAVERGDPEDLS